MKLPVIGAGVVLGFALCGSAIAAEATDADAKSGATDSTVLTQTQDARALKKQQAQPTKGGRPLTDTKNNSQKSSN
jgi:hypothetical protein